MVRGSSFRRIAGIIGLVAPIVFLVGCASTFPHTQWNVGDEIEINWSGIWYAARVTQRRGSELKVDYKNWDSRWDGWISPAPGKVRKHETKSRRAVGDPIEVKWKAGWWAASIIDLRDGELKVRYKNYDEQWDEWVPYDRIRDARTRIPPAVLESKSDFEKLVDLQRFLKQSP